MHSWAEWYEWIESIHDDLPEPEGLETVWDNLPELSPCLIDNVLRQGHKMLISGPSKAGKSFLQIELCIAIAEGQKWLGWQCTKGRVLYVNLELDRASCLHRFQDVYRAMGIYPKSLSNLDIWNLRGKSVPMADISMRAKLRGLKDTTGNPLFKSDMQNGTTYSLDGSAMNFPNNGAFDKSKALMISGDFKQLVYSMRQDITFKLFTEGVVQNTDGSIAYNLMQQDMVALRAVMRLGWEIPNPINSLKTDKNNRCPFSILKAGE